MNSTRSMFACCSDMPLVSPGALLRCCRPSLGITLAPSRDSAKSLIAAVPGDSTRMREKVVMSMTARILADATLAATFPASSGLDESTNKGVITRANSLRMAPMSPWWTAPARAAMKAAWSM